MGNNHTTVLYRRHRILKKAFQIIVFLSVICLGQPSIYLERTYGGSGAEFCTSSIANNRGILVVGWTDSDDFDVSGSHGTFDYWAVSIDSLGDILWQDCFGGSDYERASSVEKTDDGGYIIAGQSRSEDGDVFGNHGLYDCWIIKLDSTGLRIWQRCYGGSNHDGATSIIQTYDGGFALAGWTESNDFDVTGNHGERDVWILKLDPIGNIEWSRCLGGSNNEAARDIIQIESGDLVIVGETSSYDGDIDDLRGYYDYWVVQLDLSGEIVWEKCYGGTNFEYGRSIDKTDDGGFIIAGSTFSNNIDVTRNHGEYDFWIVKIDSLGTLQWQKCLGGSQSDEAYCILETHDYAYLIAGSSFSLDGDITDHHGTDEYSDYWCVKIDLAGNIIWEKSLGGNHNDKAVSLQINPDNSFFVVGESHSNDGDITDHYGYIDFWIAKFSSHENIEEDHVSFKISLTSYPNPFNSSVTIALDIPVGDGSPAPVSVEIYDVSGRRVSVIGNYDQPVIARRASPDEAISYECEKDCFGQSPRNDNAGEVVWRPDETLPSGVYLVRASAGGCEMSRRVVYLK